MPTFQFEAMDSTGAEIKDVIEAATEEDAQATIRQMGYFVTKISVKKARKKAEAAAPARRSAASSSAASSPKTSPPSLVSFRFSKTPACRSCAACASSANRPSRADSNTRSKTPAKRSKAGDTLSEAMAKAPKAFDRLYVNMIKAGEAGGALEIILQRLADFKERSESLKRKVKGAMIYPIVVVIGGGRYLDVHHDQDRARVSKRSSTISISICRR